MASVCYEQVSPHFLWSLTTAPSGPPTSVHVVVLNSTAVEVQWNLPLANLRNGVVRGFKVFYEGLGSEQMMDIADGAANEYIVAGLQPGTVYTFSVLAYTVGDGPRSFRLTVSTFSAGLYSAYELTTHPL